MSKRNIYITPKYVLITVSIFVILLLFILININNNALAAWREDDKGKTYVLDDGKEAVGFQDIDGQRYYFDKDGYLQTGKIYIEEEDVYYYADENGVIQVGKINNDKAFFLTDDNGVIQTGFVEIDGNKYYFNKRAEQLFGWFKLEDDWYYAGNDGIIQTGLVTIDDKRYYLGEDGKRVSDTVMEIDGTTYIFSADGSVDENATMLYPVYQFISKLRSDNGLSDIVMDTKVSACAMVRASGLVNSFSEENGMLENMLKNRGIKSSGGYEFSYGGTDGYNIDNLIYNISIDDRFLTAMHDKKINTSGIGMHTEENKMYFDIIFVAK